MRLPSLLAVSSVGLWLCSAGSAQGLDELTMTLIPDPEGDVPDAVTRTIELPMSAADEAAAASADGLARANQARERRGAGSMAEARDRGAPAAEAATEVRGLARRRAEAAGEARDLGGELAAEMSRAAQELREDLGRGAGAELGNEPPSFPDRLTDERPELPERPGRVPVPLPDVR